MGGKLIALLPQWVFWRRRLRQSREGLANAIAETVRAIREQRSYCECSKIEVSASRKRLRVLKADLEVLAPGTPSDAVGAMKQLYRKLASLNAHVDQIVKQDQAWAAEAKRLRISGRELLKRAASVPGRLFQRESSELFRQIERAGVHAATTKSLQQLKAALIQADGVLRRFDNLLQTALTVRDEFPNFEQQIRRLNTEEVALGVALRESYDGLMARAKEVADDINAGRYAQAALGLAQARKMEGFIVAQVNRRLEMARAEMELWFDDASICERFGVKEFSVDFTSAKIVDWAELGEKIEKFVTSNAKAVQKDNARVLKQMNRRLYYLWDSDQDATHLVKFAKAVADYCKIGVAES